MSMVAPEQRGFDAALWRAQHGSDARDNPRSGLVPALEREVLRKGMSREEVREILGPPEGETPQRDVYELGASPVGVDYEQYVIEYDEEGKVLSFGLRRG